MKKTIPLNERIRAAREASGRTQHEVAEKVPGLTDAAYGEIERSGWYIEGAEKIMGVLKVLEIEYEVDMGERPTYFLSRTHPPLSSDRPEGARRPRA